MIIKCPHCGEICESDSEIAVGQHIECPFCAKKFTYGQDTDSLGNLPNEDRLSRTTSESKEETRFCGHCGAKISVTASFCPKCGSKNAHVGNGKMIDAKSVAVSSGVEPVAETKDVKPGKFQKLLNFMKLFLGLSAISTIISCIDIRESYTLGSVGSFVTGAAFWGVEIWLYVAVMNLKSWARKSFIVYTLLGTVLFLFGIQVGGNDNLVVTGLDVARLLITLYCVYLLFTKELVAVFKPDSELTDARAVANMIHCIGYWLAFGLIILVDLVWALLHDGTDDWAKDCLEAAVAGSSSAREELIVYVANQSEDQDIEDVIESVDTCIRAQSPKSHSSGSTRIRVPAGVYYSAGKGIGKIAGKIVVALAAFICGFWAKFKEK